MSVPYLKYLLKPFKGWEDIPWTYFGYAYAGTFGSVLLFPIVYIGLLMLSLMSDLSDSTFEQNRIGRAVQLSILVLLFFSLPAILISSALVFFVLGYYLDGYLLTGLTLLWIAGGSVAMPALYYLLTENGGKGWLKVWQIYSIGGLTNDVYRKLSGIMILANLILFVGTFILILLGIGIILIPLLLLWYCYICADIYTEMKEEFKNVEPPQENPYDVDVDEID